MAEQIAFLGIDVSKGYADFALLNGAKQSLEEPFQLDDNYEGHQALKKFLKDFLQKEPVFGHIRCGIESTGGYENNWHATLYQLGAEDQRIQVSRLNPRPVSKSRDAEMQRTVTDATSASAIAGYLVAYPEKVRYNAPAFPGNLGQCRPLYANIQLLVKQQAQLKNQLEKLLYQGFPELLDECKGKWPKWVWTLLDSYPTAAALAQSRGKLKNIPYLKEEKLQRLRKKVCRESIAGADGATLRFTVQSTVRHIQFLEGQIKELKGHLRGAAQAPEIDLLTSVKGIGTYSASGILLEIGDIKRFPDAPHLASFFGIHPCFKQSGDGVWGNHMSKQGSSAMRGILYMCAKSAVIRDGHLKGIYEKFRQKGFSYNQAIGVIMHKQLRIIYGILSSGKPYDSNVDQANQKKMKVQRPGSSSKTDPRFSVQKRRLQPLTTSAPLSTRHRKKRRLHLEPQNSIAESSARSSGET
jgi:transposase